MGKPTKRPARKAKKNRPTQSCKKCTEPDNDQMVQCDICHQYYHFICVGVDETIEDHEWSCEDCAIDTDNDNMNAIIVDNPQVTVTAEVHQDAQLPSAASSAVVDALMEKLEEMQRIQGEVLKENQEYKTTIISLKENLEKIKESYENQLQEFTLRCQEYALKNEDLNQQLERQQNEVPNDAISDTTLKRMENILKRQEELKCARSQTLSQNVSNNVPSQVVEIDCENRRDSFCSAASNYSEVFDTGRGNNQLSSVEKFAVTMNRKYLQELPSFNGDVKAWAFFETVYNSTTEEGRYSDVDNVTRLRKALKPPASDLVQSLIMFSKSAKPIMDELRDAYGRPEMLVAVLVKELLATPKMTSQVDSNLRDLAIKVRNFVSNMKALNQHDELCNGYVVNSLVQRLHITDYKEWIKLKTEGNLDNKSANMERLGEFLMEKVKEFPPNVIEKVANQSKPKGNSEKKQRVMAHAQTNNSQPNTTKTLTCFHCDGNHALYRCSSFRNLSVRERKKFVYEKKICTACISSTKHFWDQCQFKRVCGINGCKLYHNRLLHGSSTSNDQPGGTTENVVTTVQAPQLNVTSNEFKPSSNQVRPLLSHNVFNPVLFKIVPVIVYGENSRISTFAFLDDGSSLTLVDSEIIESLNLQGTKEELHLQWTKGITRKENAICTSLTISGIKGKHHTLTNVYGVKNLDLPKQTVDVSSLKQRYRHLKGLPIPEIHNGKPKILIGLQHAKFLLGNSNHVGEEDDPIASKTELGWIIFGNTSLSMCARNLNEDRRSGVQLSIHEATKNDDELHALVKGFFTTESFGVMPPRRDLIGDENRRALTIMKKTLKQVDDRYEIGLLWKSDDIKLPDSFPMAMKRLITLERSLQRTPDLMEWKNNHVRELLNKNYARVATDDDLKTSWPRVWYCPTFVVINKNKVPPKPRDVADVAAQVRGESLNTNLLKGPDNMAPLLSGLFKFRENAVAVNGDVREMFHQVKITPDDQQCQRFLWRDGDVSKEPTVYVMERMMFGPTCSPACAQYVKNFHAMKFMESYPEAVKALINHTYVDDYFNSHSTVDEALKVSNDAIEICETMGFDLTGFQSNASDLLLQLPEDKVKAKVKSFDRRDNDDNITKILGMCWQSSPDCFTYKLMRDDLLTKMIETNYHPTKREVLRTLMRIFDPLGLLSMFLIRGKIVLQEIWREGIEWDEEIPDSLMTMWKEFVDELPNIENIKIPRAYAPMSPSNSHVQLVVLVDASQLAFATTAYFIFSNENETYVAHVMAKSKVAPIKQLTIPQLELQAAVLGVRLANTIKHLHSFNIHDTIFLADSKVTLSWICSKTYKFKTFVAARVGEILETTSRKQWYHVGSKDNVADDATKWSNPSMHDDESRWFRGPNYLQQPISQWPITPAANYEKGIEDQENFRMMVHVPIRASNVSFSIVDSILPRFKSKWTSLVRVNAYILRFIDRIIHRKRPQEIFLTPIEIERSERRIFMKIQSEAFPEELFNFSRAEEDEIKKLSLSSRVAKLSPFMKENLLRSRSRSQKAKISYAAKNPVILPNKHELVDLLIQHHHDKNFHIGEALTIADLREKVWIIDIKAAVKRVKRNCQLCKILRAKPNMPMMGELPAARVDFGVKPFTHVGVDAFGPYQVKFGRGSVKRYGLIFTCLTYRAVHLEVLDDMTTEHSLLAIRRFLVRRGWSSHFYSDNGKNFVGMKNVLHRDLSQHVDVLGEDVVKKFNIHWHFIPAYSPWFGGAWERLIQSIKKCIDFVMQEEKPHEYVFRNAMIEAEYWMNRRPLTEVPIDHEDAKPLTPNAILFGDDQDELAAHIGVFNVNDCFSSRASRRTEHIVSKYLSRWIKEYLPSICQRSKWNDPDVSLKMDDIVIVIDPSQTKNMWRKGRVIKMYPGSDGKVRAADVILSDGTIKYNRSTGRLAVLDVKSSAQN